MSKPADLKRELALQQGHVHRHMRKAQQFDAQNRPGDASRQRDIAGGFLKRINTLLGFPAT